MNNDKLIICHDLNGLKVLLTEKGFFNEDANDFIIDHLIFPIKKNGNKTITVVRDCVFNLADYPMLEDIGTYDDVFKDENPNDEFAPAPSGTNLEKYQSIYPYHIPIKGTDSDGNTYEYYLKKYFGFIGQ